jgi:hypothetical protein
MAITKPIERKIKSGIMRNYPGPPQTIEQAIQGSIVTPSVGAPPAAPGLRKGGVVRAVPQKPSKPAFKPGNPAGDMGGSAGVSQPRQPAKSFAKSGRTANLAGDSGGSPGAANPRRPAA